MTNTKPRRLYRAALPTRASTITLSDVRAYRVRHPACTASDDEVRELVLAEHPSDLGFAPR